MPACSKCGEDNPARARFCLACGAELVATGPTRESRKMVSILFSDVTGSTAMGERLDPESMRNVMTRYFEAMRRVIEDHGGTVEKFIGDAVMAVFGVPVLHEDDALRAVRAAVEMRAALAGLNMELDREWGVRIETRTAVNTGDVVAGIGNQTVVTGDAVNTAARLQQNASPGQILIGEQTFRLVRGAVSTAPSPAVEAKGKAQPVTAYRLLEVREPARDDGRRLDAPLVGRAHELHLAEEAFERADRERTSYLFTIFGAAGVGKSRLTQEILTPLQARATVCRGRCLSYGRGITFWPLAEIVRDLAGLAGDETTTEAQAKIAKLLEGAADDALVAERIAGLIGVGEPSAVPEEAFWAVRKLFEAQAQRRPLVVVFDDIHWAEPALLDLIEHVADWSEAAPILLLCLARPELLDARPGWAGGKVNAASIRLEPLRDDESAELVANLLGGTRLPPDALTRIVEASGGTPLFVEEMIGMLIDDGAMSYDGTSWKLEGSLGDVAVPPTITALIAARLDRLTSSERRAIEAASIVGREFWTDAVTALVPKDAPASVRAAIMSLVRKDLVRPDRSHVRGEEAFCFRHILIRNAAYNAVAKGERAGLHETFADWLEQRFADHLTEYEEIVGYHLEQAVKARAALGPIDAGARLLARRAAERLAAAGHRAMTRADESAARDLLGRASALWSDAPPAELLYDLALATRYVDTVLAESLFANAVTAALRDRNISIEWRSRAEQAYAHVQTVSGVRAIPQAKEVARRAIAVLEEAGDRSGCATAWTLLADCHNSVGEYAEMLAAAETAAALARRGGDERAEYFANQMVNSAMNWGPTPVRDALAHARRMLDEAGASLLRRATAMRGLSRALAQNGEIVEARVWSIRSNQLYRELGNPLALATVGFIDGQSELSAGVPGRAEPILRESCEALERMGEVGLLSTLVAVLGRALWELGRIEEAEGCALQGEQLGALDDLATQIIWRGVLARVRARQGRFDEAIALGAESASIADGTQGLVWQADAHDDRSVVFELAGRRQEASDAASHALELYERKELVPGIRRLRARIERLRSMQ